MAHNTSSPIRQLLTHIVKDARWHGCSDQELVRQFLAHRDASAFEAMLERHGAMVLDVCRGFLANEADAEDAFQATFLILARKAASIRKTASLPSWLHGVACRIARKSQTQSARRRKHESQAAPPNVGGDAHELSWREVRQVIHEELDALPERLRAPLLLCYLQELTQDQAAAELRLPKGTLKGRLERARAMLRGRLVRRGLGPAAALLATAWPAAGELPAALVTATVKAACGIALGQAAAGLVSAKVVVLMKGARQAMFFSLIKAGLATLVLLGFVGLGAHALSVQSRQQLADAAVALDPPAQDGVAQQPEARPKPEANPLEKGATLKSLRSFKIGPVDGVRSFAFHPGGNLAACGTGRDIHLWNLETGDTVAHFKTVGAGKTLEDVHSLAFSGDGKLLLAACGDGRLRIFDGATLNEMQRFEVGGGPVLNAIWSRDATWVVSTKFDGSVHVQDAQTGKEQKRFEANKGQVWCVLLSPDERYLLTAGGRETNKSGGITPYVEFDDTEIRLWDVKTGKEVRRFTGHACTVTSLAISKDGTRLVSCGKDRTVRLWDTATGKELKRFGGELKVLVPMHRVDFSPDGRLVLACDQYGARLLNAATLEEIVFVELRAGFKTSGFAPDGQRLLTTGTNNDISGNDAARLWRWVEANDAKDE